MADEALTVTDQHPAKLLEMAVQQDLDVDKLEKLMELDERWRAQRAKEEYFAALAEFQMAVPSLDKDSKVEFGTTKYKFASLPAIRDTIQVELHRAKLTYRWQFDDLPDGVLKATCIITHVDGHSERSSMSAPPDKSGSKNPVQQVGSTMTYLQRYTLIGALGLTTADKDDDSRSGYSPADAGENLPNAADVSESGKADGKAPTERQTDAQVRRKLRVLLKELCEIDTPDKDLSAREKEILANALQKYSEFTDSGEVVFARNTALLKNTWLRSTYGKVKQAIKERKTGVAA